MIKPMKVTPDGKRTDKPPEGELTIDILRHGNSLTQNEDGPDEAQTLTGRGRRQAIRRRQSLGSPAYEVALHSCLRCTMETALVVAGGKSKTKLREIPGLMRPEDHPDRGYLDELFANLGQAPLALYHDNDERGAVKRLGQEGWYAILEAIIYLKGRGRVLVISHGFLPAAIAEVATMGRCPELRLPEIGECDGFRLHLRGGEIFKIDHLYKGALIELNYQTPVAVQDCQ